MKLCNELVSILSHIEKLSTAWNSLEYVVYENVYNTFRNQIRYRI